MALQEEVDASRDDVHYDGKTISYQSKSEGAEILIQDDCIIGFVPQTELSNERTLLYVHVAEDKSGKRTTESAQGSDVKESPVSTRTYLRSLKLINAPDRLIADYDSSKISWLPSIDLNSSLAESDSQTPYHPLTVIISTESGLHAAEPAFQNLVEPFLSVIIPNLETATATYHILRTTSPDTITDYTRTNLLPNAAAGRPQTIILLSGDGGPVDVLNAILPAPAPSTTVQTTYKKPKLALIPVGTANALAVSSMILPTTSSSQFSTTGAATLGLHTLLRGVPHPLPTFIATLPPGTTPLDAHANPASAPSAGPLAVRGAVVASWALHAALVADSDTPAYRRHGAARFRMAAEQNLFPPVDAGAAASGDGDGQVKGAPHVYRGALRVTPPADAGAVQEQEQDWGDAHVYVLATLVSHLEAPFRVSPAGRPLDGALRVVRLGAQDDGGAGVMRVLGAAYDDGRHVEDAAVRYAAVGAARLRIEEREARWRRVCVDGKIFVAGEGGEVDVRREEGEVVDLVVLPESVER